MHGAPLMLFLVAPCPPFLWVNEQLANKLPVTAAFRHCLVWLITDRGDKQTVIRLTVTNRGSEGTEWKKNTEEAKQKNKLLWNTLGSCLDLSVWPLTYLIITESMPPPEQQWRCWWVSWESCWRCLTRKTSAPPPKRRRPLCGTYCSRYSHQVRSQQHRFN